MCICGHEGISADVFARKRNLITGLDARVKVVFVLVAVLVNLLSASVWTPAGMAVFCLVTLVAIKIPPRLLLLRMAMPLAMAAMVALTQLFLYGGTPLFAIPVLHLTAYQEGLQRGILIMWRVIAGSSLVLFLSLSTPAHQLFLAAGWFKVPRLMVELSLLIYRYIFVLMDELSTMKDAQKVRLGYRSWRRSMSSATVLGGSLILRAYDRAARVYDAMLVRGYTGEASVSCTASLRGSDYLAAFGLAAIIGGLYFVGRLP